MAIAIDRSERDFREEFGDADSKGRTDPFDGRQVWATFIAL
jgi:hypothetical protein